MITYYYNELKNWYDARYLRERILFILLTWFVLILIFYFILLKPLITHKQHTHEELIAVKDRINTITLQIDAVGKLSQTPLYKEWMKQQHEYSNAQGQYQLSLETFASKKWQDVINFILQPQSNVNLIEIKNYPETPYTSPTTTANNQTSVYQQRLSISGFTTYFAAVRYLQRLEKQLPAIHWNSLHYQVLQYPTAKIEMEVSVFYDKNK